MPQTTDRAPACPCPATGTKPHPPLSRALCILCACLASLLVVGCSDLGNYDERSVTRQAEGYYAEKYGADAEVVDIWEGRSYVLFGYQSTDMAFCTMDDGTTVLVDFEEGVVGDNRQQDEITAAYERRFREELGRGRRRLEDAGYTVTLVLINGVSPAEDGFFDGCISTYEWGEKDEAERESGSFFRALYTGDDRFFEEEASHVRLGMCDVEIDISGPDADYADAFPTNVPARPSWVEPVDATCRSLLPLTDGDPATKVAVYQAFPPDMTIAGAEDGKLGELDPFRDAGETGSWLIVDWVPVGKGAYVTSDECGVRLRSGDVALEAVDDPYSYDELWADGDLAEIESRSPSPAAFESYELRAAPGLFESSPDVRDKGWFSVRLAYDNTDPETGLERLGITPGTLDPSLYTVEKNAAAEDFEGAPPLEVVRMRPETLANDFQYGTNVLYEEEPMLLVRM